MNNKTMILAWAMALLAASARAQTNGVPQRTNVAVAVAANDPLRIVKEGLRVREAKLDAMSAKIKAAESKLRDDSKRYSLAKKAGQVNAAVMRQNTASQDMQSNQIAQLRKQKAAMELEIFDIRARYKLEK